MLMLLLVLPNNGSSLRVKSVTKVLGRGIHPHALLLVTSSEAIIAVSERWTVPASIELPVTFSEVPSKVKLPVSMPSTTAIAGINLVVFALWQIVAVLPTAWQEDWLGHMHRHFVLSGNHWLRRQLPHSYLTSGFSHYTLNHFIGNMVCLINFGEKTERALGVRKFIYLYISAVYASEYIAMGIEGAGRMQVMRSSLGASGALSAVQAYYCLRFPNAKFRFGWCQVKGPWACLVWFILDLQQLGENTGIGHGAHLGGYIFGALFYLAHDIIAPRLEKASRGQFRFV